MAAKGQHAPYFALGTWFSYNVVLPVCALLLLFPLNRLIMKVEYPYEFTFATADALMLAALLMLAAGAESAHYNKFAEEKSIFLQFAETICVIAAVIVLMAFGAIKAHAHSLLQQAKISDKDLQDLSSFATFSLLVLLLAAVVSTVTKLALARAEMAQLNREV